ncbi:anhydro-N-acetylmuramic acid kinase [Marinobacterium arenosum]|uniref:anhydro-N-acetylmuramic acid kinase n=1 Tax=Marinobacterium arenosum TaxID=2862496 RepID=UPI001C97517B|nr:anhydro-N-acetylmuramic acid kinase [Marinobacterium arenosum]MBY4678308.1 anhydro-N-acetylmuramic acid kinase [Marinobacterium arenosum]
MKADLYIGLMSGTSLDSIDAVAARFTPEFELIGHCSCELPEALRDSILQLTQPGDNEIDQLGELDLALGREFAAAANQLIRQLDLNTDQVAAIGSHGQTIRHRPAQQFTLQIGDPNSIAELTGITTIADFRRRDMAAGGQGAPLVPAFHEALFRSAHRNRYIVNIGGMANVTRLPADRSQPVWGYDTGPGNVLLDSWIQRQQGLGYDHNGQWASQGKPHQPLLTQLLALPYFQQPPPKSTGREQFNQAWLDQHLAGLDAAVVAVDVQATLLELTAHSISDQIRLQPDWQHSEVYLCGGGAHNAVLRQRIQQLLTPAKVTTTEALGLAPDWVEAAAFAWLAYRTQTRKPGSLASVTGAQGDRILGAIYPA